MAYGLPPCPHSPNGNTNGHQTLTNLPECCNQQKEAVAPSCHSHVVELHPAECSVRTCAVRLVGQQGSFFIRHFYVMPIRALGGPAVLLCSNHIPFPTNQPTIQFVLQYTNVLFQQSTMSPQLVKLDSCS